MSAATASKPKQNALEGKLILDWLLFAPRAGFAEERALAAAAAAVRPDIVPDPLTSLAPQRNACPDEIGAYRAFCKHLEDEHLGSNSHTAREDFLAMLDGLNKRVKPSGLAGLLRELIQLFAIDIYIENRSVQVALHSLSGWYQVIDRLDAEALLCLRLAELGFAREIAELDRWPQVTLVSDRDLCALMAQGVSDMHLHLGGLRNAQSTWLQLMAGGVEPEQIPYFGAATIDALGPNQEALKQRLVERDRVRRLAAAHGDGCDAVLWRHFFAPLAQFRNCLGQKSGAGVSQTGVSHAVDDLVLRERIMLARGFERLIELAGAKSGASYAESRRLEHALDLYIHTKSRFIANHRQAIRSNPGLGRHRQYTSATKVSWGWEARPRPMRTDERRSYDYAGALDYLVQSPVLRRVELRLAPASAPGDYINFLETWGLLEDRLRSAATNNSAALPDIRFSIHFKRSLDRQGGRSPEERMRHFLQELDAHSAALHEFRLNMQADEDAAQSAAPIVTRLARIDFAGQERDIFPDRAAFAMNLLRSDEDAMRLLCGSSSGIVPSAGIHRRWLQLRDDKRLHMPARLPRLGVTCHAGEDYAHPLEGVHAIITAVESLKMRAGDSVGHALALGRDAARFHLEAAPHSMIAKGAQFDALAWLRAALIAYAPPGHMQAVARIEAWLWREMTEIYPRPAQPMSLTVFSEAANLRRGPVPEESVPPAWLAGQIWWHECWSQDVQNARNSREPLADVLYEIEPSISWAQEHVAREIASRGIVVELNPSSNWRISQARTPQEIPFVAILRRFGSFIPACINTDNAGAYGTRIENEYAIALFGLMEAGMSRTEAIALLDRLRLTGLNRLH